MVSDLNFNAARRGIAALLSLSLVWTSGDLAQAALGAVPLLGRPIALPQLTLTPPSRLGRIVDYFNAPPPAMKRDGESQKQPLIVLIQDLHAHYGVQKNIAGLLDFLDARLSPIHRFSGSSVPPFALAVEGAGGPVDTSVIAAPVDPTIKRQALDYLMREGELTGTEDFAAEKGLSKLLVGVEDMR